MGRFPFYLLGTAAVAGVGGGVYVYLKRRAIFEAVNPLSNKNMVYSATNKALANDSGSLGTTIYEQKNDGKFQVTDLAAALFDGFNAVTGKG